MKKFYILFLTILLSLSSSVYVSADSIDGTEWGGYAKGYSDWSDEQTNNQGEVSRTLYSYVVDWQSSKEPINDESKLVQIYYVDTEFVFFNSGNFLGYGDPYTGDGTPKTYSNAVGITYKPVQTIYSNKWGFAYGGASWADYGYRNGTLGVYSSSNYTSWSWSNSGRPGGSAYTNTVAFNKDSVTYNPHNDDVFYYGILAIGSMATADNQYANPGGKGKYRISFAGEQYNSYIEGSQWTEPEYPSCPINKGKGTSTNTADWCYESRRGNKTFVAGEEAEYHLTNVYPINGGTVDVRGINGNHNFSIGPGKNTNIWYSDGEPDEGTSVGWAWAQLQGASLIERVYYIDWEQNDYPNVVATTWITPVWSEWMLDDTIPDREEHWRMKYQYSWPYPPVLGLKTNFYFVGEDVSDTELKHNALATDICDGLISNQVKLDKIVYQDGTSVDNPTELDTSKAQTFIMYCSVTNSKGLTTYAEKEYPIYDLNGDYDPDEINPDEFTDVDVYDRFVSKEYLDTIHAKSIWQVDIAYKNALSSALNKQDGERTPLN